MVMVVVVVLVGYFEIQFVVCGHHNDKRCCIEQQFLILMSKLIVIGL